VVRKKNKINTKEWKALRIGKYCSFHNMGTKLLISAFQKNYADGLDVK
jgi:hypothetical protein